MTNAPGDEAIVIYIIIVTLKDTLEVSACQCCNYISMHHRAGASYMGDTAMAAPIKHFLKVLKILIKSILAWHTNNKNYQTFIP